MVSKQFKKHDENNPNAIAVRKYEQEIAALEIKRKEANDARDWSMRNFYDAQLMAKRGNLEWLKQKIRRRR